MTVLQVKPVSSVGGIGEDRHQQFIVTYWMQTDTANDGPWTIINAAGAPRWGDAYQFGNDYNPYCFCRSVGNPQLIDEVNDRLNWHTPYNYTTKPPGGGIGGAGGGNTSSSLLFQSPLDEPWRISGSYARGTKLVDRDNRGIPLLLANFEIKTTEIPIGQDTLHLEGPTQLISMPLRRRSVFHVNSTEIWGFEPRQLLLVNWGFDVRYFGKEPYVYHAMDWEINYETWDVKYMNASLKEWTKVNIDGDKKLMPILDNAGMPVTKPWPLAVNIPGYADGEKLLEIHLPGSIKYDTRQVIAETDFHEIGFPDPLPGPFILT